MADLSTCTNNRERVLALAADGTATKQSLMEALGINDKSLASVFAQLRLMGHYKLVNADGIITIGTKEEAEAAKPVREPKEVKAPKSYEERRAAMIKREGRAAAASTNARKKYEADSSRANELRMIIADAELELVSILLGQLEEAHAAGTDVEAECEDCASVDVL